MRSLLNSVFVRLSLAALLASMVFSLLLHLPGFLIDLGASEFDIGVLYAVSAAVAIALSPWMGRVVDRRGSRSVIIAASLVNALVLLAYITIDWFGVTVFLVRIANTSAQIFLFTAFLTFAAAVIPESRRTQGLALFGIAFLVPIGLGSLLGDGILAIANFDALFAVAALFVLGSISMVVTLSEPRIENHRPRRSFFAALRQDDLRPLWWLMFFFAFGATSVFTFMRTFIDATGYASVGLYFGVFAATAVLIRLSASSLPDVVGQKLVLVPGGCRLRRRVPVFGRCRWHD